MRIWEAVLAVLTAFMITGIGPGVTSQRPRPRQAFRHDLRLPLLSLLDDAPRLGLVFHFGWDDDESAKRADETQWSVIRL